MGWLTSSLMASVVVAVVAVRICEYLFGGVTSGLGWGVRYAVFCLTWTAVTTLTGMHGVSKQMRRLKQTMIRRI